MFLLFFRLFRCLRFPAFGHPPQDTSVFRTKVVPNGNPCQIVRRMVGRAVPERPAHGILAGTVKRRPGGTERKGTDGAGRQRKRTGTEPGMRKAGSARNPAFGPAHGRTKYRKLLLLFAQDTHRHVENRRVVQRHDTAVGDPARSARRHTPWPRVCLRNSCGRFLRLFPVHLRYVANCRSAAGP